MLEVIQSGHRAFYCLKGLKQVVSVSSDGKKKLINATLYNGSAIDTSKNYKVLAYSFATNGGGDFNQVFGKIYTLRNSVVHGNLR
jgi:hypothetical protein